MTAQTTQIPRLIVTAELGELVRWEFVTDSAEDALALHRWLELPATRRALLDAIADATGPSEVTL